MYGTDNIKVYVRRAESILDHSLDVYIVQQDEDQNVTHVAAYVEMRPVEEGSVAPRPTMQLPVAEAQRLMDQLWDCGLRPSEGSGSAGMMAATQKHLADMRALVSKLGDVRLP